MGQHCRWLGEQAGKTLLAACACALTCRFCCCSPQRLHECHVGQLCLSGCVVLLLLLLLLHWLNCALGGGLWLLTGLTWTRGTGRNAARQWIRVVVRDAHGEEHRRQRACCCMVLPAARQTAERHGPRLGRV